jgi:hypothetical protein
MTSKSFSSTKLISIFIEYPNYLTARIVDFVGCEGASKVIVRNSVKRLLSFFDDNFIHQVSIFAGNF